MSALKEFANFVTLNMASLAGTYAQLLADAGYENISNDSRMASARKVLKVVIEVFETQTSDPFFDLFTVKNQDEKPHRWAEHINFPDPLTELECLGQTLTPVVTNLDAGKFLWRLLSQTQTRILQAGPTLLPTSPTANLAPETVTTPPTKDKQTETALEESNLLRTLIDNLPDYIYAKDTEGRFILLNTATAGLLGAATVEEALGKTDFDFFPSELAKQFRADEQALMQSGRPLLNHEEQVIDQTTGQMGWNLTSKIPLRDNEGKVIGLVGINRNITERKQAEETLRLTQFALDRIGLDVVWAGPDARMLYVNDTVCRSMGYSRQEMLSMTIYDINPALTPEMWVAHWEELKQRKNFSFDTQHRRKNGEMFPVDVTVNYIEFGGQEYNCALWRDITEQRQQEQKLQESLARRARQVQLSTQIAQDIATATDLASLYWRIVSQIKEQFGYYHVQLLLSDHSLKRLALVAGYGQIGEQMLVAGYHVPLGSDLIGSAAALGLSLLQSDVSVDPEWSPHPLLPQTKGELAVPITFGQADAPAQAAALDYFIKSKLAGFVVSVTEAEVIAPVVRQAQQQGLMVVTHGRDPLPEDNQTAWVNIAEYDVGYMLGTQAGEWATRHVAPGELLKVGLLSGLSGPNWLREKGIMAGLKAAWGDNPIMVGNEVAFNSAEAMAIAEAWLRQHTDLKMIVAFNDANALGALQAAEAMGRTDPKRFFIGGIDGVAESLAAIKSGGVYQATVELPAFEMGVNAVRTLALAIAGQPYEKVNLAQGRPVNRMNIDEFLQQKQESRFLQKEALLPPLPELSLSGLKIGLSVLSLSNSFFTVMVEGAKYEATRLGLELIVNDSRQVLGVLDVQSETAGALSAEDQLLLEGLCGQIAVAINQRRVEAERAQSEARTQLIIDSALDPVITIDAAGVITGWNPQAEAVFGWSQAEALGQTLAETIIPPQYREAHMRGLKHFLATGEGPVLNRRIEITALRRDGSEFPVDLAISPVRTGETFTFTAFIRDITERKQAEETLRQSEERYRTVLQESPDAMMIYDLEGRATYINPSFTHIFGWSAEEWLGKRIDFVPEEEKAKTQESIRETFRQGRISIESRRYTKSGKIIDVWGTASLLKNEDGNPAGILVSVRDITERKRIEAEAQQRAQFEHTLRNITDKLRAASNVEQLVAIAAEELGQRLSASYAELELGITAGSNGYPMPAEETDAKTGQARKI